MTIAKLFQKKKKAREESIPVPKSSIQVGMIAFILFTIASAGLSINYYINLGFDFLEKLGLVVIAVSTDFLKTFSLILMNYYKDNGVFSKAKKFRAWYAITLSASILSIFGTGIVLIDKSNHIKSDSDVEYTYQLGLQKSKQDKIDRENKKISDYEAEKSQYLAEVKTVADDEKPALFKKVQDINNKISTIANVTIKALEKEKEPIDDKIRLMNLEKEKLSKTETKTMFLLMSELLGINPLWIVLFSVLLLAVIIEGGIFVTSPHPKKVLKSTDVQEEPEVEKVVENNTVSTTVVYQAPLTPEPVILPAGFIVDVPAPKPRKPRAKKVVEPVVEESPVEVAPAEPVKRKRKPVEVAEKESVPKIDLGEPSLSNIQEKLFKREKL